MPSYAALVATALLLAVGLALPQEAKARVSSSYSVNCESKKGQYKECPAPWAERGVRLVEQRSKAVCTRGSSWGYSRRVVWVDKGCHGLFQPRDGAESGAESGGERLTCQSWGEGTRECRLRGTAQQVELIRSLGEKRCKLGKNWGWNRHAIWVANRCGGLFEVDYR